MRYDHDRKSLDQNTVSLLSYDLGEKLWGRLAVYRQHMGACEEQFQAFTIGSPDLKYFFLVSDVPPV